MLNGLKLFDQAAIKNEFNMMHPWIKQNAVNIIDELKLYDSQSPLITHKQFIDYIRSSYGFKKTT